MTSREQRNKRLTQPNLVNVLLVDDMPQIRDMVRGMLKANRYSSVHTAQGGNEALRIISSQPVDLVLTDWNMPGMSGIELLKKIKTDARLFRIPVLMISDEISAGKVLCAMEEGVDAFLVKPFSEEKLIKNIRKLLGLITKEDPIQEQVFQMKDLMLAADYREALALGNEILKRRTHPRVALMMCECLYNVKDYDQAIDMIMDTEEGNRTSVQTNMLGKIYMNIGKQTQGILYLEEAVKKNPLNNDRKIDAAKAHLSIGNIKHAERFIAAVMNSKPTDLNLVDIGQLYLDRDDVETAGFYLDQTVDPIPETVTVFNNYAIALRRANRFEDSIRVYKKCLQIAPDSEVLQYNLAVLYHSMARYEEARKVLEKTLQLNSSNGVARNLLEKVKAQMN